MSDNSFLISNATPLDCEFESLNSCETSSICSDFKNSCKKKISNIYPSSFTSIVTPVSNLNTPSGSYQNMIEFRMRRKNKTVTLQWEPFEGLIAACGKKYLSVPQSIPNLPPHSIRFPIFLKYKSANKIGQVEVDPNSTKCPIKFHFNENGKGIEVDDCFYIYGGSISWIVD